MRNVLMVGYYWPPLGGIGALRLVKFAKYLPEFGWSPAILTVPEGVPDIYFDPSLSAELKNPVNVYRAPMIPTLSKLLNCRKMDSGTTGKEPKKGLKNKIAEMIYIPDDKLRWVINAARKGAGIIRKEKMEAIYTTSSPYSCHLIGWILKKITGLPWVADFRDPWTRNVFFSPSTVFRGRVERWMEKKVVANADKVISTTEPIIQEFKKDYPDMPHEKFVLITNGYDPEDFPAADFKKGGKFTVVFLGSLYKGFTAELFYRALSELDELNKNITVIFVGYISLEEKEKIKNYGLQDQIEYVTWQPHRKCLEFIRNADVNLVVLKNGLTGENSIMTGKVFEYLGAGRPILALVPTEGVCAKLIKSANAGISVDPDNVEDIKKSLKELYRKYQENKLSVNIDRSILEKYERRTLAKQLAEVFDACAKNIIY